MGSFDRSIVQSNGAATDRQRIGLFSLNVPAAIQWITRSYSIDHWSFDSILRPITHSNILSTIHWAIHSVTLSVISRLSVRSLIRFPFAYYTFMQSITHSTVQSRREPPIWLFLNHNKKTEEPQRTKAFAMQALRFSKKRFMSWGLACLHFHAPKSM